VSFRIARTDELCSHIQSRDGKEDRKRQSIGTGRAPQWFGSGAWERVTGNIFEGRRYSERHGIDVAFARLGYSVGE
jgi:hypothetical protein